MTDREKIQAGYDQMWKTGQIDLLHGDVDADSIPDATSKRWGISAILRLPVPFGETLLSTLHDLRNYTGDNHTFYQPTTLHITLRSIEFFRLHVNSKDKAVYLYATLIRQLAAHFAPFTVDLAGLSANRVGIIAQGYPSNSHLQTFRRQLHQSLADYDSLQGPEAHQPRLQAHASLFVFGGPILNGPGLVAYISRHRRTEFGQVCCNQIDIVRYERTQYKIAIHTLDQITLSGSTNNQ